MKAPTTALAPSAAYLTLAHRHARQPSWPAELHDCLRDPIAGPLIRGLAWRLQRKADAPLITPGSRWAFDARAAAACNDR